MPCCWQSRQRRSALWQAALNGRYRPKTDVAPSCVRAELKLQLVNRAPQTWFIRSRHREHLSPRGVVSVWPRSALARHSL